MVVDRAPVPAWILDSVVIVPQHHSLRQTDLPCAHVEAYSLYLEEFPNWLGDLDHHQSPWLLDSEVLEDFHHVLLAAKIRGHAKIVPQHLSLRQTDLLCAHVEAFSLFLEEFSN